MLTTQKFTVVIAIIIIHTENIVNVIIIVVLVKGHKITCTSHPEDALFHFHQH